MSVLKLTSGTNKIKITSPVTPRLVLNASSVNSSAASNLWGSITGTLSDQTDLQNALNAKIGLTALSSTATGLTYTNTTGVFSLTSGYVIPTTTEQTNWGTAYTNTHTHSNKTTLDAIQEALTTALKSNYDTAYGWGNHASAGYQAGSLNLTSVSGLTYASASFVKMTGANTFALDTNTYLTSLTGAFLLDQTTPQTVINGSPIFGAGLTIGDGYNITLNTTTGTKIGTATSQKLAFYNSTPIVQPTGSVITALGNLGLVGSATIELTELSDVTISTPAIDNILKYNGSEWVNGNPILQSGAIGIEFFMDDTSIIGTGTNNVNGVNTLTKIPVTTTEVVDTINCVSNTVLGEAFLYDTALGRTQLDGGVWTFDTYASVSSVLAGRVSSITRNIYTVEVGTGTLTTTGTGTSRTATASSGTPFVAGDANASVLLSGYLQTPQGLYQITGFTSSTEVTIATPTTYANESTVAYNKWKYQFGSNTGTITNLTTNYGEYAHQTVQPTISVNTTDKFGEIVFGTSNNTTSVYFTHNGNARYSHFQTPLITMHNNLAGLNGGSAGEYYHLTSAQHTVATQAATGSLNGYLSSTDWTTFNSKAPTTSPTFATSITGSYLTASEILITDGSKNIVSAPVATYPSLTELSYVKGLSSAVQTQLGNKAPTADPTFTGVVTIPNTGLHILDTNASHDLIVSAGSDLSADRTLTVKTGDTDMILDLTAVTDEYVLAYDAGTNTWRGVTGGAGGGASTALDNLVSVAINTTLVSDTDNTDALGTVTKAWSDLFLGNGGVITFTSAPDTADVTLTHSANLLTLAGGSLALGANNLTMTGSIADTTNRVTKGWFTDVESTNMPTVGGTAILTSLTAPQFTTIELGHASDTTLARSAAGVVTIEGKTVVVNDAGVVNINATSSTSGTLKIFEDTDEGSHSVSIKVPALAGDYTLTLPTTDGDANQVIATDGSGNLSFVTPSGGATILKAVKTADETVNNSNTYQDDDHLTVTVEANTTYAIRTVLKVSAANSTPNIKVQYSVPASTTMNAVYTFFEGTPASTIGVITTASQAYMLPASVAGVIYHDGGVFTSSTAGTFTLQWAQNTAHASNTKVLKGSYMILTKI